MSIAPTIKKTVVVHHRAVDYIIAIFNAMDFVEESRSCFSTDQNGETQVVLTFIGEEKKFDTSLYIFIASSRKGAGTYYSVLFTDGVFAENISAYKELYKKRIEQVIEVKSLNE